MWRSSPASPGSARRGAWRVGVAKCWLPRPPRPPRAATTSCPSATRSARTLAALEVADHRPARDLDDDVLAGGPALVGAATVLAALRLDVVAVVEVGQGGEPAAGAYHARCRRGPPSPPLGPPRGTNFSRRKLTQPRPPSPAFDEEVDLVEEHQAFGARVRRPVRSGRSGRAARGRGTGFGPSTIANSVSSPPRPTLVPGFQRVPRCRTMIVPPSPADRRPRLTPRRCALRVAPVAARALTFLVRHRFLPPTPRWRRCGPRAGSAGDPCVLR